MYSALIKTVRPVALRTLGKLKSVEHQKRMHKRPLTRLIEMMLRYMLIVIFLERYQNILNLNRFNLIEIISLIIVRIFLLYVKISRATARPQKRGA